MADLTRTVAGQSADLARERAGVALAGLVGISAADRLISAFLLEITPPLR